MDKRETVIRAAKYTARWIAGFLCLWAILDHDPATPLFLHYLTVFAGITVVAEYLKPRPSAHIPPEPGQPRL